MSTAAQSEVDTQETLVRSVPMVSSSVQLVPPFVVMKTLPVLSTVAKPEFAGKMRLSTHLLWRATQAERSELVGVLLCRAACRS